ncbi:hypothetical protein XaFJ1_GM001028 [Xanthomonas albilineans]|nr:hypothetical protein XaFJ1_GM001028 [Xanthomonas albilineans]
MGQCLDRVQLPCLDPRVNHSEGEAGACTDKAVFKVS